MSYQRGGGGMGQQGCSGGGGSSDFVTEALTDASRYLARAFEQIGRTPPHALMGSSMARPPCASRSFGYAASPPMAYAPMGPSMSFPFMVPSQRKFSALGSPYSLVPMPCPGVGPLPQSGGPMGSPQMWPQQQSMCPSLSQGGLPPNAGVPRYPGVPSFPGSPDYQYRGPGMGFPPFNPSPYQPAPQPMPYYPQPCPIYRNNGFSRPPMNVPGPPMPQMPLGLAKSVGPKTGDFKGVTEPKRARSMPVTPITAEDASMARSNVPMPKPSQCSACTKTPCPFTKEPSDSPRSASSKSSCPVTGLTSRTSTESVPQELESDLGDALLKAIRAKNFDDVVEELGAGADPNYFDVTGNTALHLAAKLGREDILALLLEHGASTCKRSAAGLTALHVAAQFDTEGDCVEALIEAGSDPRSLDREGRTPLHYASENDNVVAVGILMRAGGCAKGWDKKGNSPLSLAASQRVHDALRKSQ